MYIFLTQPKILPQVLVNDLQGNGDRQSSLMKGLKRELGGKYFVTTWEWFWAHFTHAFMNHSEVEDKRTPSEQ